MVSTVGAPVVGVEDPPGFEVRDEPFDGGAQRRNSRIVVFVSWTQFATGWSFPRSGHAAPLITLVTNPAAGLLDNLFRRRGRKSRRIMRAAGQRVGNINTFSVEQADHLHVEPGCTAFTAPQLMMLGVGPAGREGAVDQAHP